ncbi:hypothetical protein DOY81_003891 [Sarcophaga bullata]|nr:hypothetical protein DOY81_003891 [Sarcophaga bullata]
MGIVCFAERDSMWQQFKHVSRIHRMLVNTAENCKKTNNNDTKLSTNFQEF